MPRRTIAAIAAVLILLGGMLAHFTQTTNDIRIEDVRFKGAAGKTMSALIYIPRNASERSPAPGILDASCGLIPRLAPKCAPFQPETE